MTIETIRKIVCDGCGEAIHSEAVLPVFIRDGDREVHCHDYRCLGKYAQERDHEHVAVVRKHLEVNVQQTQGLLDSADPTHKLEDKQRYKEQLAEHKARLESFQARRQ